jgi:superfamily II DNA helicase RecQ
MASSSAPKGSLNLNWDIARVRQLVQKKFQKRACLFQVRIALALYEGKDVVGVAATGAGKTLTFLIPPLMAIEDGLLDKISFIVTPLNLLGKQNERQLKEVGISAIAVSKDNACDETFKVSN